MAGMHKHTCKSLQEYRDENLEHFLTADIIVSSVGGQALTQIQPTYPTDIADKWEIVLEVASCTLECTTQRGLWTLLHLSLIRRLQTNDQQLQYRRMRHDCFGDTLLAGTKSKLGDKYAKVFVTKFGWSRVFPMANKGDVHDVLSLLFQRDGVPTNMIVYGLKEQNLGNLCGRLQRLAVT